MTRELIYERSHYGEGWTAWDGEYRDRIPGAEKLTAGDFQQAVKCAVTAWGNEWADAIETKYDGSHTN